MSVLHSESDRRRIPAALPLHAASYLLPLLLMCAVFAALQITPFGRQTLLYGDSNGYYINYLRYLTGVVRGEHSIVYSFSKGAGGNIYAMLSYLLRPDMWFYRVAGYDHLPEAFTASVLLMTPLAGLTMHILLSALYGRRPEHLIFSTSYALMGFLVVNNYNIVFVFGPVMLPLMALGLMRLLQGLSPLLYILSIAYAVATATQMGFALCTLSLLLYIAVLYVYGVRLKGRRLRMTLRYALASLCAGLLPAVVWLPEMLSYMGGRASQGSLEDYVLTGNFPPLTLGTRLFSGASSPAQLISGLPAVFCGILPLALVVLYFMEGRADAGQAEAQNEVDGADAGQEAAGVDEREAAGAAGSAIAVGERPGETVHGAAVADGRLGAAEVSRRERIAAGALLVVYMLAFTLRTFNSVFQGFAKANWFDYRYSFVFSFLLLMIGAREFTRIDRITLSMAWRSYLILVGFALAVFFQGYEYTDWRNAVVDLALLLVMGAALYLYRSRSAQMPNMRMAFVLLLLICVCLQLYINYYVSAKQVMRYWKQERSDFQADIDRRLPIVEGIRGMDGEFYRMENEDQRTALVGNDAMMYDYNGLGHTSSERYFVANGLRRLGLSQRGGTTVYYDKGMPAAMDALLGVRYLISEDDLTAQKGYDKVADVVDTAVYRNPYALPIGVLGDDALGGIDVSMSASVDAGGAAVVDVGTAAVGDGNGGALADGMPGIGSAGASLPEGASGIAGTGGARDNEDIFALQNAIWRRMAGGDADVFILEEDYVLSSHNVTDDTTLTAAEALALPDPVAASGESRASQSAEARAGDQVSQMADVQAGEPVAQMTDVQAGDQVSQMAEAQAIWQDARDGEAAYAYRNYIGISFTAARDGAVYLYDAAAITKDYGTDEDILQYVGSYRQGERVEARIYLDYAIDRAVLAATARGLYVYYADLDVLRSYSEALRARGMTITKESDTTLSGGFVADEGKRLLFTIPYDEGWQLTVDGEEVPLERAMGLFLSAEAPMGAHGYVLTYHLPGLALGAALSILALLGTVLLCAGSRQARTPGQATRSQDPLEAPHP